MLPANIMKVAGITLLMTISKHLKFGSAGKIDNMNNKTLLKHFKFVLGGYAVRRFKVTVSMVNNQFKLLRCDLADPRVLINVVLCDEHVPEVERYNRAAKK